MFPVFRTTFRPALVLAVVLAGVTTIELLPRILLIDDGAPMSLADSGGRLIGAVGGYLLFKVRGIPGRVSFAVLLTAGMVWYSTKGAELWVNKVQYGTFTGRVGQLVEEPVEFLTAAGDTLHFGGLAGEYNVMLGWHSDCGVCKANLAVLQKLYDRYKDDPAVGVYSCLCLQRGDDLRTADSIAARYGHNFPSLSVAEDSSVDRIVKSKHDANWPIYLVFDRNGTLLYKTGRERIGSIVERLSRRHGEKAHGDPGLPAR